LLFAPCCLAIAPCCSTFLVDGPCCPTIVPCYSPFSSTSCPLTPLLLCCLVVHYHTLLFCLVCWYSIFTLLCRWKSLEQHQQASSNNKGFFLPTFIEFFLFCLSFLFWIEYILFWCSLWVLICCCFVCLCAKLKFRILI
jgi:hypothetical protein